jgi:hypothetical protein
LPSFQKRWTVPAAIVIDSPVDSKEVKRRSKLSGAYLAEFDRALAWAKLPTSKGNVWAQLGTDAAEEEPAEVESGGDLAL